MGQPSEMETTLPLDEDDIEIPCDNTETMNEMCRRELLEQEILRIYAARQKPWRLNATSFLHLTARRSELHQTQHRSHDGEGNSAVAGINQIRLEAAFLEEIQNSQKHGHPAKTGKEACNCPETHIRRGP